MSIIVPMKKLLILFASIFLLVEFSYAQMMGSKFSSTFYLNGMSLTGPNQNLDTLDTDVYAGYKIGYGAGTQFLMHFSPKTALGIDLNLLLANKPQYKLNQFFIGLKLDKYITTMDARLVPYIHSSVGVNYVSIDRAPSELEVVPNLPVNENEVIINTVTYRTSEAYVNNMLTPSFRLGAGVLFRISSYTQLMLQASWNQSFVANNTFGKEIFTANNGNLGYLLLNVGLRFNLKNTTTLY